MKPLKEHVCLTLDQNLLVILKELAKNDERSLSQYINNVLKAHVLSDKTRKCIKEIVSRR